MSSVQVLVKFSRPYALAKDGFNVFLILSDLRPCAMTDRVSKILSVFLENTKKLGRFSKVERCKLIKWRILSAIGMRLLFTSTEKRT